MLAYGPVVALAAAFARIASADAIPEKATQLAERGRELHDGGNYAEAIAAFKEAYVLAPSAGLLFDLAQAYRLAGECDDAAWMYRRYLDTDPPAPRRALAEGHLQTVEKCGHGGLHMVILPQASEVKLAAPPAEATVTATVTPTPITRTIARDKHLAEGFALVGATLIAGAAIFALDANSDANAVTTAYKSGNGKGKGIAATDVAGQTDADFALGLGLAGGASLVTAAVFYALGWHTEHELAAAPMPHGTGMAMTWKF